MHDWTLARVAVDVTTEYFVVVEVVNKPLPYDNRLLPKKNLFCGFSNWLLKAGRLPSTSEYNSCPSP